MKFWRIDRQNCWKAQSAAFLAFIFSALLSVPAHAKDAEIVFLVGKSELKDGLGSNWNTALLKQALDSGWFVRTLDQSQMGLLFNDRTQIRLGPNSQLQIKSSVDAQAWSQTQVKLQSGRAWSQARPQVSSGAPAPRVTMETPTVTMSIRGTDWDVIVAPDGRTELAVLSGVIRMENEFGQVSVGKGEGAAAEVGKAPVKFQLINPAERVQWVNAHPLQPRRWVTPGNDIELRAIHLIENGNPDAALAVLAGSAGSNLAAALLSADVRLFRGEYALAVALLALHARDGQGDPAAVALMAHSLVLLDKVGAARALIHTARQQHPAHLELLLAAGQLAVLDGNALEARSAYAAASTLYPDNAEAWYGAGLVEAERENVGIARELLGKARAKAPLTSRYPAEQGTLETFANHLEVAEQNFNSALELAPDDYVALTGRGILRLKTGDTQAGLADFLRAGVIEPRYARAWLYSGVAFYQLGEVARALEAFRKASELDPKDPLPFVMRSVVRLDALDFQESIDDAVEANRRMPWLKSLNQILNNQKGNANLGSALAAFGMEEWARHLADEAYSPWWAGSHLFLADRYQGSFNKNSALFKGFLADPTVFGASNRHSSLVASPGQYGALELAMNNTDFAQRTASATTNGLSVSQVPVAWFAKGDLAEGNSRVSDISASGRNLTLGLGMRPTHELAIFAFATDSSINAHIQEPARSLSDDRMNQSDSRADAGFNIKLSGTNQLWFKAGAGRTNTLLDGALFSTSTAAALNRAFATNTFTPNGRLNRFQSDLVQEDVQLRHVFQPVEGIELGWGVENAHQNKPVASSVTFNQVTLSLAQTHDIRSNDLWLSATGFTPDRNWTAQADLANQQTRSTLNDLNEIRLQNVTNPLLATGKTTVQNINEWNPRVGIKWASDTGHSLRLVTQEWRRPAGVNSLGQSETLGIAVNDRLVTAGGMYRRARLQNDLTLGNRTYVEWYVDREQVKNLLTPQQAIVSDIDLTELESLRKRKAVFGAPADYYEKTPQFSQGEINSFGIAVNYLTTAGHALSASYVLADAKNTLEQYRNLALPYLPRHTLRLASNWTLPQRWVLGVHSSYRTARFKDEANLSPLTSGWVFGSSAYWESADKRWAFEGRVDNLHANKQSTAQKSAGVDLVLGYRF